MSLFQEENILTKEIEYWRGFADSLKSEEDKKLFLEMLEKCEKYSVAINAKGKPFPSEPLIMALLLEQHKMINWLQSKILIPKQRFFECSKGLSYKQITVLISFPDFHTSYHCWGGANGDTIIGVNVPS